jgi:hypothetical protein
MRYTLVLVLGALAGCGSSGGGGSTDIKPTMMISNRTDAEIALLISAAGGSQMFSAQAQVLNLSPPRTDPCPVVAITGDTVMITGGCTTLDSVMITGSATIQNPEAWDPVQYNYQQPTIYEYAQLTFVQAGYTATYDGYMKLENNFTTYDADITATEAGQTVREDIYIHCNMSSSSQGSCALSGSGLEFAGEGVLASGGQALSAGMLTSHYTLKGLDTLTATIANGCTAWMIEGTTRQTTCP